MQLLSRTLASVPTELDDKKMIGNLLWRLKQQGVFLVPIGCLEDWVALPHSVSAERVARYKPAPGGQSRR